MRKEIDLSVYLVLDPGLCGGLDGMIETARIAAENGATVVQLRAPDWKKKQLVECARKLKEILDPLGVPLIINDHADVCKIVDADGLHIGQKDLSPMDARMVIGEDKVLGLSISSVDELATVIPGVVDHIGIGPVFDTATKKDAAPEMGYTGLEAVCKVKTIPAVAIGSVKTHMCEKIFACGVEGVAVVSAICGQKDVAKATRDLVAAVAKAKASKA